MRVLGLDPGSRKTGFGVVERDGNRLRCVTHGTIAPAARLALAARLHAIATRVGTLIESTRPDTVVIEEAFYHESVRSTLVLGHVRGALLVAAVEHGVTIAEYSPREIKLSVTGSGAAAKEQVGFMVCRLLGLAGTIPADASDALAAAVCHLNRARFSAPARAASAAATRLEALLATRRTR
ncbi:MAG: crossover junction endodeoxyribonuclease RuvC [Candidatus Eisenbacteria bacterium]|uniref:Crossover junction endodeoxyribonuclease RuvC n=1 Tax=Eiseniibacteriota bacterium TaxID=2212470 RepID=A0A9D6L8K8_UNCEI|nr:crossover junction endodeoxyribonuclease RuvC [Candidatus Eisenbacteria bacterium]MBI3539869.1 crossover junction endodeoxyribonuclease RuvC [Candidatus Eisenbacteria bacterium]